MENIVLFATITSVKGNSEKMTELLQQLVIGSRNEPGCIGYDLHLNLDNPDIFVMHEIWNNEAALEEHSQSKHFTNFQKVSEDILESLDVVRLKKISVQTLNKS